jgi:hypothetical protein
MDKAPEALLLLDKINVLKVTADKIRHWVLHLDF